MKTMSFSFSKAALAAALALAIVGCSSDNATKTDEVQPAGTADDATKNYFLAVDGEGYVNIYKDDGIATTPVGNFKVSAAGDLKLGEMHFHKGRAFVVIEEGLKDGSVDIGGGVAIIDVKAAIANPSGDVSTFLKIVPLTAKVVGGPSRIVHTSVDPDGKYLWLNNDGPRDNTGADSVFVIKWDHPTAANLTDYVGEIIEDGVKEIAVGNGHKKSAFSHTKPNTPLTFATHNLSAESVSIIDNNPMNTMTFRTAVLATIDLKTTDTIDEAGGMRVKKNTPHGMDFSIISGRFYTGITPGEDMGMAIIDPAKLTESTKGLTSIKAGMGMGQIPVAGYVHASRDGEYIYTVGYKGVEGYLSIIKAGADTDTVHQVIKLGNFKSSSFDISHMEHAGEHHVQILVPGGFRNDKIFTSRVAVIEIDGTSGKLEGCDAAMCDAPTSYIDIGATRGEHLNGEVTEDGTRAIYPNNDCKDASVATAADDGPDCKTINVIDVVKGTVSKLATAGRGPGSIGIVSKASLGVAPASGGGGGGGGGGGHGGH